MELQTLIEQLSVPAAYPDPADVVEVRHTHISVVFLAGSFAYKIKKPVKFGFLDFGTLEKRLHFCREEIRLNQRLAPDVYLEVVPVLRGATGIRMGRAGEGDPPGEVIEWAVKMKRLPDECTLQERLQHGEVNGELLKSLAVKIARFHAEAEGGERIAAQGRFEVVAGNARENFDQAEAQVGSTVSGAVIDRLRSLTESTLARLKPLIESRARRGVPRDTHGDLRLEHVYSFPDRPPPGDLAIIDCIEFNERFRFADPIADIAFLVMDLTFQARPDLAWRFAEQYFQASGDQEGRALLPFYVAYRAVVRGKVEGFELNELEIPQAERDAALARARAHWLLALGKLETASRRPCLVLVGGLPGTGKSTLAQSLAERANFHLIRSDVVRKELTAAAGSGQPGKIIPTGPANRGFGEGIYTPAWNERTYAECLSQAEKLLFEGQRVIVDASFGEAGNRRRFLASALRWGVPVIFIHCQASPETVRRRLEQRRGDASDADWSVYKKAAERWDAVSSNASPFHHQIATDGTKDQALARVLSILDESRLADPYAESSASA